WIGGGRGLDGAADLGGFPAGGGLPPVGGGSLRNPDGARGAVGGHAPDRGASAGNAGPGIARLGDRALELEAPSLGLSHRVEQIAAGRDDPDLRALRRAGLGASAGELGG